MSASSRLKFDWYLVLPSLLLLFLGLTVLKSVASDLVIFQLLFTFIAIVFFLLFSSTDFQLPLTLHLPIYFLTVVFLLTPFVFGIHSRGALRWLQIGQFSLQPSELAKPFLLMAFAMLAISPLRRKFVWLFGSFMLPWTIIFFQPDLGTSLVIFVGWLTILLSRLSLKTVLLSGLILAIFLFPISHYALKNYQKDRLLTFANPYRDPLGQGYHVIQSLIAVGSGSLLGRGLGHGPQSQLRFLPEHHTDFIFAAISEELGFVGSSLVLTLFAILLWRIYRISQSVSSPAASLFCLSVLSMLTFQIFINIGMNMGIAPITGIPLPYLSYGGSSLLSLGILIGLVNSISTRNTSPTSLQIS